MSELRKVWECEECGVRQSWTDGAAKPKPSGWVGALCTACSLDAEDPHDFAERMILEGRSNHRIYAKGVSSKWLNAKRAELIESGDLDPDKKPPASSEPKPPSRKPKSEFQVRRQDKPRVSAVEEALRSRVDETDKEVADKLGVVTMTVKKVRVKMGIPAILDLRKEKQQASIRQAFVDDPSASINRVHKATGSSVRVVKRVRAELAAEQQAVVA